MPESPQRTLTRRLGAPLRTARKRADLTLKDVAACAPVSFSQLAKLERGETARKADLELLEALVSLYGIAREDLLRRAGHLDPSSPLERLPVTEQDLARDALDDIFGPEDLYLGAMQGRSLLDVAFISLMVTRAFRAGADMVRTDRDIPDDVLEDAVSERILLARRRAPTSEDRE